MEINWAKEVIILVTITVPLFRDSLLLAPTDRRLGGHLHLRRNQNDFIKSWAETFCLLHTKVNSGREHENDGQRDVL